MRLWLRVRPGDLSEFLVDWSWDRWTLHYTVERASQMLSLPAETHRRLTVGPLRLTHVHEYVA